MTKDIQALLQWLSIRENHGTPFPPDLRQLYVDIDHSSLLNRLLEGKEPLPIPPPRSYSYPWYSLIEDGYAYPGEVWEAPNDYLHLGYSALIIDQCLCWKVLSKISDTEWIASYSYQLGEETKWSDDQWRVYQIGSVVPRIEEKYSWSKLWKIERLEK